MNMTATDWMRSCWSQGVCPECGGRLAFDIDEEQRELWVYCYCTGYEDPSAGVCVSFDEVFPELLELARKPIIDE